MDNVIQYVKYSYNEYSQNNYNDDFSTRTLAYFRHEAHKRDSQASIQREALHKEYYILSHKDEDELTSEDWKRLAELHNILH